MTIFEIYIIYLGGKTMDNSNINQKLMNTITETYNLCKAENIGISLNHLRYLCKNNIIPTCKIGRKYLINWNILMNYLNGEISENLKKLNEKNGIRRIND